MTLKDWGKWLWGERVSLSCLQFGCLLLLFGFIILCGVLTPGVVWTNTSVAEVAVNEVTQPAWIPYAIMAVGGIVVGVLVTVFVLAELVGRAVQQGMRNM